MAQFRTARFQSFETRSEREASAGRVAGLRRRLRERGVDGFILPRSDPYLGEAIAPRDERLAWLLGFTGSAGTAVILAERVVLFVDGRYTLQAAAEVDPSLVEVVAIHERPLTRWLREELAPDAAIGFDPWLHSREEAVRLCESVTARGARLVPLEPDPVDEIWPDQPPPPASPLRVYPEELAGMSAAAKRRQIAEAVRACGAAATVLSRTDSIAWLLNIRGADVPHTPIAQCRVILREDGGAVLFIEAGRVDAPARAHLGEEVAIRPPEAFEAALGSLGRGPVLLDPAGTPAAIAARLEAAGTEILWREDPCLLPKAIKTAAELAAMRRAHRRDGAAMARFLHWLESAVAQGQRLTEIDVVIALENFRAGTGELLDIAFDTICGAGPNGAIVHYRVTRETNRALSPGTLLLVDSGAQYLDGTTDVTRTLAIGPVDPEAVRPFTLVLKGMIAVSRARWPSGTAGRDLDSFARAALWRAGLDYDHGTGHGVGVYLNVHEGPQRLSRRGGEVALEPGMILSNEPGYYRAGRFGIRIENLVAVHEPGIPEGGEREMLGFETLTLVPIERRLIDPTLLDRGERAWLDAYHARVRAEIGPALEAPGDAPVRAWLAAACAPIA